MPDKITDNKNDKPKQTSVYFSNKNRPLFDRVEKKAEESRRSVNDIIMILLEQALDVAEQVVNKDYPGRD